MSTPSTTENPDLRRLTGGREWYGCLTMENLDAAAERIRSLLEGRLFTFVTCNEYFGWKPEVRTSQRLREGVKVARDTLDDGRVMGHITICDTYGVWGIHTTLPDLAAARALSRDELVKGPGYLHLKHESIEIEHCAPAGNRMYWVARVEYPENLED